MSNWKDGLPPVGEVCEYRLGQGGWFKCEIKALCKNQGAIVYCEPAEFGEQYLSLHHSTQPATFRPLKSEADRKRDEAIAGMVRDSVTPYGDRSYTHIAEEHAEKLYDEGYRKAIRLTDKQINDLTRKSASSEIDELEKREFIATIQSLILGEES